MKKLINKLLKIDIKLLIIIILTGIIIFLLESPIVEKIEVPVTVEVEVPGKDGEIIIKEIPKPYRVEVEVENPINLELKQKFEEVNDSIKKLLFTMAIAEKEYNISFKDSIQNIDVYSKILNGELADQSVKYNIFPRKEIIQTKVEIDVPKLNQLYYGFEVRNSFSRQFSPVLSAGLMFKNKKDNIFKISFDTERNVILGYYIPF